MRATTIHAPYDMRVEGVPDPVVQLPTGAVVRVLRARVRGGGLWACGDEAVAAVRELTRGQGAHGVVEAVGTEQSMRTAVGITRDGGAVGCVGVPHGSGTGLDLGVMFDRDLTLRGGVAPVRAYLPGLLPDVLDGAIDPSPVFDRTAPKVLVTS